MKESNEEKLVITPLNASKEISQVLANDTCRAILDVLADEPLSASQVAGKLTIPLSTADYNIKKLESVDLITVHHKRWSPKGNKVNFYAPRKKYIVLAPGSLNTSKVLRELKGLLPLVGVAALASGAVEWFTQSTGFFGSKALSAQGTISSATREVANTLPVAAPSVASDVADSLPLGAPSAVAGAAPEATSGATQGFVAMSQSQPHYGFWLFIIALIAILMYALYKSRK